MARYLTFLFSSAVAAIAVIGGLGVAADPFRIYHDPLVSIGYSENERYRLAGLINEHLFRRKDRNAVVLGTSMSDNTDPQQVESLFPGLRVAKLIMSGSNPREQQAVANRILGDGSSVTTVFLELKDDYWAREPDEGLGTARAAARVFPRYLYDASPWNDARYVFNLDTLAEFYRLWRDNRGDAPLQGWFALYRGRVDKAREKFLSPDGRKARRDNALKARCAAEVPGTEQIDATIDMVRRHPDVTFHFYIPPYHAVYYTTDWPCDVTRIGRAQRDFVNRIARLPNADLYGFAADGVLTLNDASYKDTKHYLPETNRRIFADIAAKRGRLTQVNYDAYFRQWLDHAEQARRELEKN